jgi:hypothetical protein
MENWCPGSASKSRRTDQGKVNVYALNARTKPPGEHRLAQSVLNGDTGHHVQWNLSPPPFADAGSRDVEVQVFRARPYGAHGAIQFSRDQREALPRIAHRSEKFIVVFSPALIVVKSSSHVRCL